MSKLMIRGLLCSLVLLLAAVGAATASEDPHRQSYVVIVGISEYADKQIKPRTHAEADAKALYDIFVDNKYLGVDAKHIRLLLGTADSTRQSEMATRDNILKALRWEAKEAGKEDLVVFAFIGQGAPVGDRTCYFASDSTFEGRAKNAVVAAEIEHELEKLKSQRFCVFLDVNFKGFDSGKDPAPELNLENFLKTQEYLGHKDEDEENTASIGRIIFRAGDPRKVSIDLEKHGIFSEALLHGLRGEADKEGYEPDGVVTAFELVEYLEKEVPRLARQYGKTKEEKEQAVFVVGGRASHFDVTRNPKAFPKVQERLAKLDKLADNKTLPQSFLEEGHNLLAHMPKLEAYRSLRKDYQKLTDGDLSIEDFTKDREQILEGMKLKRSVAQAYARKIIQASEYVREGYIKDVNQGKLVAWAVEGLYRTIEEKIPQDIKEQLDKAKEMNQKELTDLLVDIRERLGKREDLDKHKDMDFTLQQMLRNLDPYTTYIDPETWDRFRTDTSGNFTGIGIQIRTDSTRDMLRVVTPIKDSPAYKAGVKTGDILTRIIREVDSDGEALAKPEIISTKGLVLEEAVRKIKGKPNTKVKITIEREGVDEPLEFEITRGSVDLETVLGYKRNANDNWDYVIDSEHQICYVRLTTFANYTYRDLNKVLAQLKGKPGIKGFVLDLRFNPGGLLTSAVEISDAFIDDGLIVTVRDRAGHEKSEVGEHDGSYLNFPMVCLVNGGSASGSEIVSACLQDHKRAIIVGERSYGKGSVQNLTPFEGGRLKITIASFWRPSGKNLNKASTGGKDDDEWGVSPDPGYKIKLSPRERADLFEYQRNQEIITRKDLPAKEIKPAFKDRQLELALDYLRNQIKTASRLPEKKAG